jgi:UDP-2,3-diacylglucosamine pyrophosphatase LpxH
MAIAPEYMKPGVDLGRSAVVSAESALVPTRYRSIFLSDIHLGTIGCNASAVLRFLANHCCDHLYLVGDILDIWMTKTIFGWPSEQMAVVRDLLSFADGGAQVHYILGNHDCALRALASASLANISIARDCIHETADGRRMLVTHGDRYDGLVVNHEWVARTATRIYHFITKFNNSINRTMAKRQLPPVDICRFVRERTKAISLYSYDFIDVLTRETKRRKCDGVICGHIHRPEIRDVNGVHYHNTGDWVENSTAIVEHFDGRLELINYPASGKASGGH